MDAMGWMLNEIWQEVHPSTRISARAMVVTDDAVDHSPLSML